jgi:hypothetical protein
VIDDPQGNRSRTVENDSSERSIYRGRPASESTTATKTPGTPRRDLQLWPPSCSHRSCDEIPAAVHLLSPPRRQPLVGVTGTKSLDGDERNRTKAKDLVQKQGEVIVAHYRSRMVAWLATVIAVEMLWIAVQL